MIKTLQLKLVLLLCMIMGAGTAWADEVQLSEGVHDGSAITWTLRDGSTTAVTIKQMKGAGAAVSANYISAPRVYRANLLSFEAASGYAITNISITYSGNYKGTTITSGTELSGDDVTSNTADITQTLSTESNGTHTFASSSSSGLSAIYIQNGTTSATNTQLRPTKIDVTFVSSGGSGTQTVATPSISGNESFVNSTEVTISCSTDGATIQYSTDDGSTWTNYSAPFTLTATTTVQAKATKSGMTESAVASKTFTKITPLANIAALTANTENGTYYVTLNNAVVTFVSGNYAYIQDASGAVAMYKSGHGLTAGDVLNGTATVAYQLRNANPQITDLSGVTSTSGTAPDPTSVAQSAWNYTFGNVLSQYFQITGATITTSNNKYYVSLGGEDVQLYKIGTAISSLDLTKTYTITGFPTLYNTTKELQIFEAPEVEVGTTPTIIASPSSLSGFTYEEGNGPSDAKTISVSGSNLTANITVALTSNSDFELSTNENSGYANSITLTQSSGTVAATTVYVRLKAGLVVANNYSDDITISSTGATDVTVSLAGSVTNAAAPHVTWDLTTNSYASATADLVTWTSSFATMTNAKGTSSTAANNYLGGDANNRTSSRFYSGNTLTISPASGYAITSVEFTATSSSYASALANSNWTNASAVAENTTVTVTPTDGDEEIYAAIGGACGFTAVTVYYTTSSVVKYDITLSNNVENGSIAADKLKAEEGETVTLTATPATNYALDSWIVLDANSQTVNVAVDGSDANKATFIMPASDVTVSATFVSNVTLYTVNIDSNISNGSVSSDKSTAAENDEVTLTVTPASGYALDALTVVSGSTNVSTTKVNSTTYTFTMPAGDVTVSATFAQFTGATYTRATSLVSGKKYIIVGKDDQDYYAMGEQRSNNRAGVGVTVSGTTATVSSSDVYEFEISGPDANNRYTIYDETIPGYLYAAASDKNYLKTQTTNDVNGEWTITIDASTAEASVVADGSSNRNVMHFNPNSGNPIFSCYASTSTVTGPVYFYVKDEAASSVTVTIKANFPATTFSTDKALDFTNVTDATAYIITDGSGTSRAVTKVPANTGLYIEAATTPTSGALEVVVPVYTGTEYSSTTDNKLIATTASTTYNSDNSTTYYAYGHYTGNNQDKYAFMKIGGNGLTPGAGKALLAIPTGNAKDIIDVNGGATSIDNLQWTIDNSEVNGIYDLQGRRVVAPTKGIYIVNGRKVVIK